MPGGTMNHKKIARQLMEMKNDLQEAREENEELRKKLASHQQRQQAEDILIKANDAKDAPSKLNPASVEDFLAKRASLEDRDNDYLEKVAAAVDFAGEGDGFELADRVPGDPGDDPKNLGAWILNN